jgi:uncharacterized coiled-coil DUF342 family protein
MNKEEIIIETYLNKIVELKQQIKEFHYEMKENSNRSIDYIKNINDIEVEIIKNINKINEFKL